MKIQKKNKKQILQKSSQIFNSDNGMFSETKMLNTP